MSSARRRASQQSRASAVAALIEPGFAAFANGYWFAAGVAAIAALLALVLVPRHPRAAAQA